MGEQKTGTVFVRTKKDRNYTVIDNTFLRDDRLSAQAKGVFAYILYLPEDWCIYQSELVNHFSNGRDALRSAIKELEDFGYISKEHKKDEKTGRFTHWQYTVNEIPVLPETDLPKTENPTLENPTLLNTDNIINTNNTNSLTNTHREPPRFENKTKSADADLCESKKNKSLYSDFYSLHSKLHHKLFEEHKLSDENPVYNYGAINRRLKSLLSNPYFTKEKLLKGIENAAKDDFVITKNKFAFLAILSEAQINKLVEGRISQTTQIKQKGSAASKIYGKQNWDIEY